MITYVYLAYLAVSLAVTVGVGRTLHHHGRPFLIDVFSGRANIADAVNHLLLVGFYLVNAAFVLFLLRSRLTVTGWEDAVHLLSGKFGILLTTLGVWHFANVAVLTAVRKYVWERPVEITEFVTDP